MWNKLDGKFPLLFGRFLKWNFLAPMRFGINIPWVGVVLLVGGTLTIDFNGSS
jgi:hypothetical protein